MATSMFERVTTTIITLSAVAIAVVSIRSALIEPASSARPRRSTEPTKIKAWQEIAAAGRPMGDTTGPVVITQFSDFQCPFCRRFADTLRILEERYRGQVTFVYRHFPLDRIHRYARVAALASECAADQGRFRALHDALFERQDSIGKLAWSTYGKRAAIPDLKRFERCISDSTMMSRVTADAEAAKTLQLRGTPTIMVNGLQLNDAPRMETLDRMIKDELAKRR